MSQQHIKQRFVSAPYAKNDAQPEHSGAFPKTSAYSGFLDIRFKETKNWARRYFVVSNNFLLFAATPHAKKLDGAYPLEGAQITTKYKSTNGQNTGGNMTFELFMSKKQFYFRAPSPQQCSIWKDHIYKASKLKIKDVYKLLSTLGESDTQTCKVVKAQHKVSKDYCAIKIVDKRNCESKKLKTEIQILKKMDSAQIVQLYDIFETKKYLYMVMEYCRGGELFDQIAELDGDHYTEQDCCLILHQIAKGVKYMHECGIVHRDLKPENILCVLPNSIKKVKLCDFGISKMIKDKHKNQAMHTMVGTMSYSAPEILKGKGYDYQCDFWSIGVIMYILLCGYPPFWGETDREISSSVIKDEVTFEPEDWEHVSEETIKLCKGLLHKDPKKRASTDNLLNLTFKVSSKNVSCKRSRINFRKTVLERKLRMKSKSMMSSTQKSYTAKDDMNSHGFGKRKLNAKQQHPWRGRRGSKTAEEMELNLPDNKRISMVEDFETDIQKKRKKKGNQQ